ncbi:MAG: hypothetical protein CVT66_09555 [Actinobacteria bacterium HGW-Actinobacteria-6]|jgi:fructose-1,6-bisphosphatase/inositol monophosphatase family enzyme|nr:MAG: hypothetical protein CVT66_09555 [Actinobacteria bacterium HGW-Actinobacteria-6]
MGIRAWVAVNRNDEREQAYLFRAGAAGCSVMSVGSLVLAFAYLLQGCVDDAVTIIAIIGSSQIVFWGLLLHWRVGR